MQNIKHVNKQNPCPHCGKPDWCYSLDSGLTVCKRGAEPATGWRKTTKKDKEGDLFYAIAIEERKEKDYTSRPKQTRYWEYPSREGAKLVRVVRVDEGNGKKIIWQEYWLKDSRLAKFRSQDFWVKLSEKDLEKGKCTQTEFDLFQELKEPLRQQIPIYRYADIKTALTNKQTIFVVEGESCADELWKLGIPATCNIGGSKKWIDSNTKDLEVADIVICPDRDKPGMEHAERISRDFPQAKWLYAYPESNVWQNLPKSDGLDVADWLQDFKLSKEEILSFIEGKKRNLKVVSISTKKGGSVPVEEVKAKLSSFIESNLSSADVALEIAKYSDYCNISEFTLNQCYKELLKEYLAEEEEDIKIELEKIIFKRKKRIDLKEIIPLPYAKPIQQLARWLNLREECYANALITGLSPLFNPKSDLTLSPQLDFKVSSNLFGAIVSPSSQKKTPILKAMIKKPMQFLQRKAREQYQYDLKSYAQNLEQYEELRSKSRNDAGAKAELEANFPEGKPQEPRKKIYYFTNATGEGISTQVQAHPNQGILYLKDELAGIFKSANQYRGGKGSDSEDLLEYYDGTSGTLLRVSGVTSDVDNLLLGLFGTVQPKVIHDLMGDHDDSNGNWARFMFVNQPIAPSRLPDDQNENFDITEMMESIYEEFDKRAKEIRHYRLSNDAYRYYKKVYDKCEMIRADVSTKSSMSYVWGKTEGRIGKIAMVLHELESIANGEERSSDYVSVETLKRAVKWATFTAYQIESLYDESDENKASTVLGKVMELAERKGDWIAPRDILINISKKLKANSATVIDWFNQLVEMGHGEIQKTGRTTKFRVIANNNSTDIKEITEDEETLNPPMREESIDAQEKEKLIEETKDILVSVEDQETLAVVRSMINPDVLKLASRRLPEDKFKQIKQWIFALDASKKYSENDWIEYRDPMLKDVRVGIVDRYFDTESLILKDERVVNLLDIKKILTTEEIIAIKNKR
jgi:hypothetical protein